MRKAVFFLLSGFTLLSCTQKVFIVRHAEKQVPGDGSMVMSKTDPPLTEAGKERAEALRERLKGEKVRTGYTTNYIRTISTLMPTANYFALDTFHYAKVDEAFLQRVRMSKGNVLVVGHSNTVDDIVNGLTGKNEVRELSDSTYNHLYIVKLKGKTAKYKLEFYGK
ncbi:histidine phosphatase family protein [Flavihumibacter rivuli]|uniref:SixA phosphatase family protein n=1 Tax=Flavihumibacter rivuli TaxID=2838156 RepID=UPI001BDE7E07|nr:phosphoglycerate mutase family protein [Flavihumibacter rivuli]ULQ57998.1 histidine phosphatase family protein [Flavihumibacter rivuli]